MFACQNFLQQSCRKFYREQNLFYGHLMKLTYLAQKGPTRQIWGCFQHLEKFSKSGIATVCSIDFRSLISRNRGRSGSCSSWQCCRTQLVLQLCQLHHLLIRCGLGDNRCRSHSFRRPSPWLNRSRARRRGRPAKEQWRHLAPVRRPWPRSSAPSARMTSTATPRTHWTRPFSPPSRSLARNAAAASSPSRAHSGELKRAPRCVATHQNSSTALP